jgi:phosphoribosylformylglycinamidine (FGAM) synthase PurS component
MEAKAREELSVLKIIGIDPDRLKEESAKKGVQPNAMPPQTMQANDMVTDSMDKKAEVTIKSNFCKMDMDILDQADQVLDPFEQAVYKQLYRLSYGNGQNWCTIGYIRLAKRSNMTRTSVRNVTDRLHKSGWVATIEITSKGKTYRVFLPCENGFDSKTVVESVATNDMATNDMVNNSTDTVSPESMSPDGTAAPKSASDKGLERGMATDGMAITAPNIDLDQDIDPLSPDPVKLFYTGIGQKRISKTKREKGVKVIQELEAEGFSQEDIQFAINWTVENTSETLYDISIIRDTIGQALEDELNELGEKALKEIRESGEFKEAFITEHLITAKENEILRRG